MTKCVLCVLLILSMVYNECFSNFTEDQKEYTRHAKILVEAMIKLANSKKDDASIKFAKDKKELNKTESEIIDNVLNVVLPR